jgi:NADH:ubiquinone oxidoreductase subunit 5 (subunit L)/multisubunit Na+/H+ antiporter MnhA subunit
MEAPVPASALIHSATLVSAGVYLILRFNHIFDSTEFVKFLIPIIGSITAAYGGLCAISQSDIKKTLAYSTISHCGFLMVLCATEMNEFTILYLYIHGFFKAGVFMCVGNVLRISRGYQDTRRMGALFKYLPFEYFCMVIGLLNLAGIPFTFGFVIKHLLLISLNNNIYIYYFVLFNSFIGAFAGLFYSYKIINYTFCDFKKGDVIMYNNLNRQNYTSIMYSNASFAANIGILFLFLFSYLIIIYIFNCFLSGNYQFSDYINTTLLLNFFIVDYSFNGFLLNFSYINITATIIINYLFWSKFRKLTKYYNFIKFFFNILLLSIFVFIFYNIL